MKSLHLTNQFHQTSGGISTFYRSLFTVAGETGHRLVLVASGEQDQTEQINDCVTIHYLAAPAAPFFDRRYRVIWPGSYLNPFGASGRRLRQLLCAEQPDLIEIGEKYTLCWLAGMIRKGMIPGTGRPVLIGTSHERMDDNVRVFLTPRAVGRRMSQRYLGHLYIPLFDHHLANSRYTAAELEQAMVDHHQRPVEVIPMGADIERYHQIQPSMEWRNELVSRIGGGVSTLLLLYVGRLSPEKNVGLLVDLMEKLRQSADTDYRLLIAGSGPLEEWLRREARQRDRGLIHILKALGASKGYIITIFLKESLLICSLGIATGLLSAFLLRIALVSGFGLTLSWEPDYAVYAALGGILSGLIGALYPAWRAARIDAVDALSYE